MSNCQLINANCLDYLQDRKQTWTTIFADPPDGISLNYNHYNDRTPPDQYVALLRQWLNCFILRAKTVWFSYNARWTFEIGKIVTELLIQNRGLEAKPCVQTFSFGQHCHTDLGNNHRPLLRLRGHDAPLLPDAIRVPSWRQEHGDKRADPRGRVPGDHFNFPRVTGNSKQRRPWHPTQLNEGLVERCIKLTTPEGGTVLDPFAGTGTTLRVCKRINLSCTLLEVDTLYCAKIAEEHALARTGTHHWESGEPFPECY